MSVAFAFDLDGTVTLDELLPLIAKALELEEEIEFLTDLTINSVIPFDMSFKLRFALLKSIKLSFIQSVIENASLDDDIAHFIRSNSDNCYIVTGNIDQWVKPIIDNLGCEIYASKAKCEGDCCTELLYINKKAEAIQRIRKKHDFIVAIGEGANDTGMFQEANLSICYGGVHSPYKDLMKYANYLINDGKTLCRLLNTLL